MKADLNLERHTRVELAACYRLMVHIGVEDLTYNHISARVPGEDALLVKPGDMMFREVTASSLRKYSLQGEPLGGASRRAPNAITVIHANILKIRPDLNCVIHTHTPANVAVSAQEAGLLPISQHALMFYGRVAVHEFGGFEFDLAMKDSLARDLGDKSVALLRNHGVLVAGASVGQAFVTHHFYEMACRIQIGALAGGQRLVIPPREVCERAVKQVHEVEGTSSGAKDWPALLRLADKFYAGYAD